jgi:hypothetical protein
MRLILSGFTGAGHKSVFIPVFTSDFPFIYLNAKIITFFHARIKHRFGAATVQISRAILLIDFSIGTLIS